MRLTQLLQQLGRQLLLSGSLAVGGGLIALIAESVIFGEIRWDRVGLMFVIDGVLIAAIYAYQRFVYWGRLRKRLLQANVQAEAPTGAYRPLARWFWAFWVLLVFFLALVVDPSFTMISGSLLIGYGLSAPLLAANVAQMEAGRIEFYTARDLRTGKAQVVRVPIWKEEA